MNRPWTKDDEQLLREYRGQGLGCAAIAKLLDRTDSSIKTRINRIGLSESRVWTPEQIETARANRGRLTAAEIAKLVGKSPSGVHQLFNRLGLSAKRKQRPELLTLIKEKHALGWSDAEVAAEWNRLHPDDRLAREWICEVRRDKLKLPHNAYSDHRRQKVAAKTREQVAAAGLKTLAEVRVKAFRDFAKRQGWPDDLRPRAVQILKLLYETGPKTRREICDAIGMTWRGSRKSLCSNDPEGSYLAHLQARGLVIQLSRVVKGKGSGHSVSKYAVAPHIRRGVAS